MPYKLDDSAMAESPDGKGVLLFGGNLIVGQGFTNEILELRAGADSWTVLDVTLQDRIRLHSVIPIP